MMIKNALYILFLFVLFPSCKEVNINQEVKHASLLDSVLFHQQKLMEFIDTNKVNYCIQKTEERIALLNSDYLNDFQKHWLHHEKKIYEQISNNLKDFNHQIDSIEREFNFSKSQIKNLKNDLIHRHLSKEQFNAFFIDEQRALANLNTFSAKLNSTYNNSIADFDSIENKLHGILTQLDALRNRDANTSEK